MELSEKVNDLEHRVTALEVSKPYMEEILKEVAESNKVLGNAIGGLQGVVNNLSSKIDAQGKKIDKLDEKVETIEDEHRFNIAEWVKKNWPWIVVVIGVGGLYASQYVKF